MKYSDLQVSANKTKTRVGRGISAGRGKTAGRGTKGQRARSGKKLRPMFQGGQRALAQAVPKKRGFKTLRTPAQVVYLDTLVALKGKTIDNMRLFEEGYIATPFHAVKVIMRGQLDVKIDLKVQAASKSVVEAIKKAGGSFEQVEVPIKQSQKAAEEAEK